MSEITGTTGAASVTVKITSLDLIDLARAKAAEVLGSAFETATVSRIEGLHGNNGETINLDPDTNTIDDQAAGIEVDLDAVSGSIGPVDVDFP